MISRQVARFLFFGALASMWCRFIHATPALGTATPKDATEAQRLFDQALELLDRNQAHQACPMFEKSLALDPGIGTQFQLADCYERIGRRASAYRLFGEVAKHCAELSAREHELLALERQRVLEQHLETIEVKTVPPNVDLVLSIDGSRIVDWSKPIPLDPGEHRYEAKAGHHDTTGTVTIVPGSRLSILTLDTLRLESRTTDVSQAHVSAPSGKVDSNGSPHTIQRTAGYVSLGLGVVGLGVGGVWGLVALSKKNESDSDCSEVGGRQSCTTVPARELHNDAVSAGNLSTGFFIAGGVLATAGITLLLTAPRSGEPAMSAGFGFGQNATYARLGGRF